MSVYDAPEAVSAPGPLLRCTRRSWRATCHATCFMICWRRFKLDQTKTRFNSIAELEGYSRDSANPVGRLVLLVAGYRDQQIALLSDKICTALQLANFWQDVVEDWEHGRRYLPGRPDAALRRNG